MISANENGEQLSETALIICIAKDFTDIFRIDSCIQRCSGLISSIREKNRGERNEGDKTSEILR